MTAQHVAEHHDDEPPQFADEGSLYAPRPNLNVRGAFGTSEARVQRMNRLFSACLGTLYRSPIFAWAAAGCSFVAGSSAACGPSYTCYQDSKVDSVSVDGAANVLVSDAPDAYVGGPWTAVVTDVGPTCLDDGGCPVLLGFTIYGPDGMLGIAFNMPAEAGVYLFQDLVISESLDAVHVTLAPTSRPEGGVSSDGSADDLDGSTDRASVTPTTPLGTIPLTLTGPVEISSSEFGMCDSSIGCWYDYTGQMALVDPARGIAALNISWTESNSGIDPIDMCSDYSSGDVPF